MDRKIMVTGGAGFLGSHLCDRLMKRGDDVLCVDNFFTGTKRNVEHLLRESRFELVRHDVTFPLYVEVERIFNLACPASPVHYQADPVQTTKTSVHGAINMLGLAKRVKARILQASTSEVYGDPEVHPQTEDYWGRVNCIGPRSCYDEGKRCAGNALLRLPAAARSRHQGHPHLQHLWPAHAARRRPRGEQFHRPGASRRGRHHLRERGRRRGSFCYVDDLIDGMLAMMDSDKGFFGPVNLGNPGEFTMLELAEKVLRITGSKSRLVHKPLPQDDPRQRKPNIALAQSTLRWEPKVALEDGLKETVAYFKKLLSTK